MNVWNRRHWLATAVGAAWPWTSGAASHAPLSLAADFDPAAAVWLGYADGHAATTRALAQALHGHVALRFLVADEAAAARVRAWGLGADVVADAGATFFLRDEAVFARAPARGAAAVVGLHASQYGAQTWCRRRHADDAEARRQCQAHGRQQALSRDALHRVLAGRLGLALHATPLAMEGGGVESDGRGTLIANAALWRSRNADLSLPQIERELRRLPGVARVIWLDEGLAEDPHLRATIVGDHVGFGTGGHTDQFVRFAAPGVVLLARPDAAQAAAHPVARITRARMQRNRARLQAATDARGQRLRVVPVPMPEPVQRRVVLAEDGEPGASEQWRLDYFPPREGRRAGDTLWQVAPASWLNFVVANGVVVLPDFTGLGTPAGRQAQVQRLFESAFDGRRVVFVDATSLVWSGGGLHCASLNQPAP